MYSFYWFIVVYFGENFFRLEVFGYDKLSKICLNFRFEWDLGENLVLE